MNLRWNATYGGRRFYEREIEFRMGRALGERRSISNAVTLFRKPADPFLRLVVGGWLLSLTTNTWSRRRPAAASHQRRVAGTRRFNSSAQFSTTLISVAGFGWPASSIIRNRCPSGETSYATPVNGNTLAAYEPSNSIRGLPTENTGRAATSTAIIFVPLR